jgi:hypothetical protein
MERVERMTTSLFRLAIRASLALAACAPMAASAEWLRADTKHFVIYSDGRQSELEQFAIEAEKFDAMLRRRLNVPTEYGDSSLPIYILSNSEKVSKLRGVPKGYLGGFYTAPVEGAFAISNRERPSSPLSGTGQEILFHEYTHHFFTRYVTGSYPIWLFEGLAEYFSTTEFDREHGFTLGNVANGRAYGLMQRDPLPIGRILTGSLDGLDARERDMFYGRSWLLTHMLMSSAEGRQMLGGYLRDFGSGVSLEDAATRNFGDIEELDKKLVKLTREGLPAFKSTLPIEFDAAVSITELDKIDSERIELQLNRRNNFEQK